MLTLNDENFEREIGTAAKPVLVDFWATWCMPCTIMAPILEKIAEKYSEKIIVAKANVDESPLVAEKYNVSAIPNVVLFKEGKPMSSFIGVREEEFVEDWLEKSLNGNSN